MNNMNEILTGRLDEIFGSVEFTSDTVDLYDEVFINLKEACSDYMESGLSCELAIEKAFEDLGDLSELLNELSCPMAHPIGQGESKQQLNFSSETYSNDRMDNNRSMGKPFPKLMVGVYSHKKELVNHVAIPMKSITNLSVMYVDDKVEILPSNDNYFHIYEYMNLRDNRLFAKWQVENNTLTIKSGQRPLVSIGVNSLLVKAVILVPKAYEHYKIKAKVTSGTLKIEELAHLAFLETEATSGSQKFSHLNVDELKVSGNCGSINLKEITTKTFKGQSTSGTIQMKELHANTIKANSISGGVKLEDTTILENLDVEAISGTVKITDCNTNMMKLRTTSGSIKGSVSHVSGTFKSKSGSIKLITSRLEGNVELNTASGSISLQLKEEQKFNFKLRFGSGSGKVKLPKTTVNVKKNHVLEGFVGEASDVFVNGETLSGSITIKEA